MSEVSEKEKENSELEEKESDTARTSPSAQKVATPKSRGGSSKPGSAVSRVSVAESARSATGSTKSGSARSQTAKSSAKSSGKGSAKSSTRSISPKQSAKKKSKPESKTQEDVKSTELPSARAFDDEGGLPDGVIPLFLATKSQEIFQCRGSEDVTEANPYKLLKKEDILKDLFNRAAISDFHPIKQIIQEYPEEDLLIGYDADFKYGQNFYIATTEEAKQKILAPPESEEEKAEGGEVQVVYKYVPPVSKPWQSLGSDREVKEETLTENRPRVSISIKRKRREFGAPVTFTDRNVTDAKDGMIECASYEEKTFDLKRMELDKATQAIAMSVDTAAQTDWKYPRNATTQYEPREFSEEEKENQNNSVELKNFVERAAPKFDLALQQNEIMDVFYDDWKALDRGDGTFGSKADNHLKEYQSFTDLQFSKNKTVTCIDWHPTVRGVVAMSVGERLSLDERIDNSQRIIMTPSLILIWSFTDPIHPQLILEAPDDILCFKFCPTDPNLIAGGCINGQVVLWDISQYSARLKQSRATKRKDELSALPGFEEENATDTHIVRYCAVSSIEHSHKAAITDILWMPDHFELTRMGVPQENKGGQCVQLITCATDHLILVWDIRPPKAGHSLPPKPAEEGNKSKLLGVPTTFKHLDLTWKPHLKVSLYKSEPGGDHAPVKFSISEKQGDRSILTKIEDSKPEKLATDTAAGGFAFGNVKPGSGKRALTHMKTFLYAGTEDGEIVYADWMPQKDQDSGKIQTPKPDYYHTCHSGAISTLQRSPFFKDIVLCVGGWTFSLWKEGVSSGPILKSASSSKRLTSGHWSPSRPAVFYITRFDGSVDIWDLLDRTHEPSMNQSVCASPITSVYPFQVSNKQHLLAIGDHQGTLHIMEIPWSLKQPLPNEILGVSNYFEREVKRRAFVVDRWDSREREKMEMEAESKRLAGIAPNVQWTEEEQLYRMKQEYVAYVEEETAFLRQLGLKEDADPLPVVE